MRNAFLKTLFDIADRNENVQLVVGDLGFSVVEAFAERHPSQFLNAGIAEQNMTGVAAGMASLGKIVFTYSIGNFPTLRCLEQIRNDICYHKANVKIVAVGGGMAYGSLGCSHQATEDLAIMRALPEMVVVAPADPIETKYATEQIARHDGPCYLRLGKAGEKVLHNEPINFCLGKAIMARDGADLALISTGAMLGSCLAAADRLKESDISIRVLSMHTIKPIDADAIYSAMSETKCIMTVEEHNVIGGLGSAVAEVMVKKHKMALPFRILGMNDIFCKKVGDQKYLRSEYGLSVESIVIKAKELLNRGN